MPLRAVTSALASALAAMSMASAEEGEFGFAHEWRADAYKREEEEEKR